MPAAPPPAQPVVVEPTAPPVRKEVHEDVEPPHNVSRANETVSSVWSPDPARTYRLALFTKHF